MKTVPTTTNPVVIAKLGREPSIMLLPDKGTAGNPRLARQDTTPIICQDCEDRTKCKAQYQGQGHCLRFPNWKNPPISQPADGFQRPQDTKLKSPLTMVTGIDDTAYLAEHSDGIPIPIDAISGNQFQAHQDSTGDPVTIEAMFQASPTPRFRFFMTQEQGERVKAAIERNAPFKMGVSFEVIPVPENQVEDDPERFESLIEVTVDWKNE
jgi:hypothetical protein